VLGSLMTVAFTACFDDVVQRLPQQYAREIRSRCSGSGGVPAYT
jgi:hypothetical protein